MVFFKNPLLFFKNPLLFFKKPASVFKNPLLLRVFLAPRERWALCFWFWGEFGVVQGSWLLGGFVHASAAFERASHFFIRVIRGLGMYNHV